MVWALAGLATWVLVGPGARNPPRAGPVSDRAGPPGRLMGWVLAVAGWLAASAVVALVLGRAIALRDRRR